MTTITGGCLCGQIRYTASQAPRDPHFCSCKQCQRASGAPVVAWVDFAAAAFAFDGPGGEPTWYRSSDSARRGFCPSCGGAIGYLADGSDLVGVTTATLDDPDGAVPTRQSFPDSAPAWLRVGVMPDRGKA